MSKCMEDDVYNDYQFKLAVEGCGPKMNQEFLKSLFYLVKEKCKRLDWMDVGVESISIGCNCICLISKQNLVANFRERNDAILRLRIGDNATQPKRTVTSFAGFTYKKPSKKNYLLFEATGEKEYEVPNVNEEPQKLWGEKQNLKRHHADYQKRYREI